MRSPSRHHLTAALAVCASIALSGCATYSPKSFPPGTPIATVQEAMGKPTGQYPRREGGTRLEYMRGRDNPDTFMVDFDAGGRLVQWVQVKTERSFAQVERGWTTRDVLYAVGSPSWVTPVAFQGRDVWNYRYYTNYCQVFQLSISKQGTVVDTGYGRDPMCSHDNI